MTSSLTRWLATLDVDGLARVLDHRPEVTREPIPRSLGELAERLQWPGGASAALHTLPLPATQLVEAVLGTEPPTPAGVAATVGVPVDALSTPLRLLSDRALVWPDGEQLQVCVPLVDAIRWPFQLGRPAENLLARARLEELKSLAGQLGLPTTGKRTDVRAALAAWYADAELIRELVAGAPAPTRALLDELAWHGPFVEVPGLYPGVGTDRVPGPVGWAVRHGLVMVTSWHEAHLPREVALALRGPDWRPPLDLTPPEVPTAPAVPEAVDREAAATAGAALDQIAAVLAACGHPPLALLKSGGVGVREIKRLARSVGVGVPDVSLWLELGLAAGLLAITDDGAVPTARYDQWSAADPAERLVTVLSAWWSLPSPPTWAGRQSPPPVLRPDGLGPLLAQARRSLLTLATELPQDRAVADPGTLADALTWRLPVTVLALEPAEDQVIAVWREAGQLGLVAHGAASALGRALAAGDLDALTQTARRVLPPPTRQAIFQADLTAVVPGSPAAALADLLDSAADREARGAASTWRFTADSVRRALDSGHQAGALADALAAAAVAGELPQALTYLISDTARRHGLLRVREVRCVLHAQDPALLVEVAATRSLATLGLSVLAPTVLGSTATAEVTLRSLRAAGYAPVGEDSAGAAVLDRLPRARAEQATTGRGRRVPVDHLGLAKALLVRARKEAGTGAAARVVADRPTNVIPLRRTAVHESGGRESGGHESGGRESGRPEPLAHTPSSREAAPLMAIARYADQLGVAQRRLLADALERQEPVRIAYVDSAGQLTHRIIEQLELDGDSIVAWCRMRDDERRFLLGRITTVAPA